MGKQFDFKYSYNFKNGVRYIIDEPLSLITSQVINMYSKLLTKFTLIFYNRNIATRGSAGFKFWDLRLY